MVKKTNTEADAGSMAGYDPNLGLPKNEVANSGFTPKKGPMAPKNNNAPVKPLDAIKKKYPVKQRTNRNPKVKPVTGNVNGANIA